MTYRYPDYAFPDYEDDPPPAENADGRSSWNDVVGIPSSEADHQATLTTDNGGRHCWSDVVGIPGFEAGGQTTYPANIRMPYRDPHDGGGPSSTGSAVVQRSWNAVAGISSSESEGQTAYASDITTPYQVSSNYGGSLADSWSAGRQSPSEFNVGTDHNYEVRNSNTPLHSRRSPQPSIRYPQSTHSDQYPLQPLDTQAVGPLHEALSNQSQPQAKNQYQRWGQEDTTRLSHLLNTGASWTHIEAEMGRTRAACLNHRKYIKRREEAERMNASMADHRSALASSPTAVVSSYVPSRVHEYGQEGDAYATDGDASDVPIVEKITAQRINWTPELQLWVQARADMYFNEQGGRRWQLALERVAQDINRKNETNVVGTTVELKGGF